MSEVGYNVWGAVTGAFGIAALVIPIANYIISRYPSRMLPSLHEHLRQTQLDYDVAINDGLLHQGNGRAWLKERLSALRHRSEDLRAQVYDAQGSWRQRLRCWRSGTSSAISVLCEDLTRLQATLVKTSSREREALASSDYPSHLDAWSALRDGLLSALPHSNGCEASRFDPSLALPDTSATREAGHSAALALTGTGIVPPGLHGGPTAANTHLGLLPFPGAQPRLPPSGNVPHDIAPRHILSAMDISQAEREPYRVSNKALQDLLSYAAENPPRDREDERSGKRNQRALRRELLLRFGKEVFSPEGSTPVGLPRRRANHTRFKAARQLMRRTLGVRPQTAADKVHPDPESFAPQRAGGGDCEEDEWCDA